MVEVKFSIITPVYNTEAYLNRCIESIVSQTYQNWELILVDDGSDDNSLKICQKWADKDVRIKVIAKKNEGQGIARNLAMQMAQGDYLCFVDSDDWIEVELLEMCQKKIEEHSPEMVCFFIKVWSNDQTVSKKLILSESSTENKLEYNFYRSLDWVCRVYRREWLLDNTICFAEHIYEDMEFMALATFYAKKIVQIHKAFYNYERRNMISTTHISKNDFKILEALEVLYECFKKRNIYEEVEIPLGLANLIWLSAKLNDVQLENKDDFIKKSLDLLKNCYPSVYNVARKKYLVWGSYSLRRAVNSLVMDLNNVTHFQFSSLIGAIAEKSNKSFEHSSSYRKSMVENELQSVFWTGIQSCLLEKYDYLIIDFLEERYDIYETDTGYRTASDAYIEGKCSEAVISYLSRLDTKVDELWQERCNELIKVLKQSFEPEKVILVKNYLMESFGEYSGEEVFENISWIKQINQLLKKYYEYIEKEFEGIRVIEVKKEVTQFSDITYRYGCYPWHYNEARELDLFEALWSIGSES